MNKKEKRAALKAVLTDKVQSGKLLVLDELKFDDFKTKKMKAVLTNLKISDKALVVIAEKDDKAIKSASNLPFVGIALPNTINVYDIMRAGTLVLTKDAVNKIEEVYA
jgi:large subunit ribosomal protein L4